MTVSPRWKIALLLGAAIAVSYFDRQTLPVAIKAIQLDIPISNTQFSQLQAAFLTAYAFMYAGGGKLIDVLGTRRGFLWIMILWSAACASHGLATTFGMLAMSRLLLGLGEGGGFPAATKAVAEWFPVRERSTAMGIVNAGTSVGAVIAPPLIALVLATLNWRWVFFLAGMIGLLWTIWWLRDYHPPAADPGLNEQSVSWFGLFRFPQVWGLVFAKFLSDAAWYFYLFWLPKYLYDVRHFDTKQVGYYALDSLRRRGYRQRVRRMVFEPVDPRRPLPEFLPQNGAGTQRGRNASGLLRDPIAGPTRTRIVQHRVRRAAVVVHSGNDSAGRLISAPRGRVRSGSGRIRRSDGRSGIRTRSGIPARSRLRLRPRVRHGQHVPCACVPRHPFVRPGSKAGQ